MKKPYLYSNLINNFRFLFGLLFKKIFIGPHTVMLDIEDECDLHCDMCFYHSPAIEERLKQDFTRLNYSTIKSLVLELSRMGTRKITICGKGEPFLHPDILKIIELIKTKGFYLNIFTNGIHIDRKILDAILKNKVDQITFSLHAGDEETYLRVHPQVDENAFRNILGILEKIKKHRGKNNSNIPYVKIVNVIFKSNYKNVDETVKFANRFADEILFKPVVLYKEQKDLNLNPQERIFLIDSLKDLNCDINNNITSYLSHVNIQSDTNIKFASKDNYPKRCFIPWYQSVIMTNGDVAVCPYNQKIMGNIKNNTFSSIWYSSKNNDFRKNIDCKNCKGSAVYPFLRKFQKLFV